MTRISIHAPTRGATRYRQVCVRPVSNFNPRSHEGSDASHILSKRLCINFNPRSHEGSDILADKNLREIGISIHAPTRGATVQSAIQSMSQSNFNPRSHEGSDVSAI